MYLEDNRYYGWLLFPLLPYVMGSVMPWSIALTNTIKPGAQVLSHIPQLYLCWQKKTTSGVSLPTQHLNVIGGLSGLMMCFLVPPKVKHEKK